MGLYDLLWIGPEFTDGGGFTGFFSDVGDYIGSYYEGLIVEGGYDVAMRFRQAAEAPGIAAAYYLEDPQEFSYNFSSNLGQAAWDTWELGLEAVDRPQYLYEDIASFGTLYYEDRDFRNQITDLNVAGALILANPGFSGKNLAESP